MALEPPQLVVAVRGSAPVLPIRALRGHGLRGPSRSLWTAVITGVTPAPRSTS